MSGPTPKNTLTRQRRNKAVTRATLPAEVKRRKRSPMLPKNREWQPMTRRWWKEIWASPMAGEYLRADMYALFMLAVLIDMFWLEPSKALAAEIRLQQQAFGLTPLDRRRLEWSIEQLEQARDRGDRDRIKRGRIIDPGADPRDMLK